MQYETIVDFSRRVYIYGMPYNFLIYYVYEIENSYNALFSLL